MDNDTERKYTLTEYIEYLNAPMYARDGFDSEAEYQSSWCNIIKKWYEDSDNDSKSYRDVWQQCYKALNEPTMKSVKASPTFEDNIASSRIPIVKWEMRAEVAMLYTADYIPMLVPLQDSVKPLCAMGNMYLQQEFLLNFWTEKKFGLGCDGFVTDMWIARVGTTDSSPGPFGQKEKITISRVNPMNFYPDMKAPRLDWECSDYWIIKESMDIGVARNMFKDKAALIDMSLARPEENKSRRFSNSQLVTLPGMRSGESPTDRARLTVKECWFHDERYKFVGEKYDDTADGGTTKIRVDDDGYVIGHWEKAYPDGRCIVTCNDQLILRDLDNPFWAGEAPFIICKMSPEQSGDAQGCLLGVGKAADLLGIERKTNDVECRVHSYAQSEIERPIEADVGALTTNMSWWNFTGRSRSILLKYQGKEVTRREPVEVPAFITGYLQRLDAYTQKCTGRPGIMQGQITEGAQLGAQALKDTQMYGASQPGMESVFIASAMRRLGFQVFELVRQTYPEDDDSPLTASMVLPNGKPETITWNSKKLDGAYFMTVDLQANQPGGKAAAGAQVLQLYKDKVTDRLYTLQNIGIDGWQDIWQRISQDETQKIFDQAAGRAAGLQIKSLTKDDDNSPGPTSTK